MGWVLTRLMVSTCLSYSHSIMNKVLTIGDLAHAWFLGLCV